MFKHLLRVAAALALGAAFAAHAQTAAPQPGSVEAQIKKAFEEKFAGNKVDRVTKTPYGGLYELVVGDDILYTDEKVTFAFDGALVDAKTRRNVTQERIESLSYVAFKDLPFEYAIKQVKGNGARKIAVFEDPNCGYCKMFRRTLQNVDNITVYTFLYPILAPDSTTKARTVWCAENKGRVWDEWMLNGKLPAGEASCNAPLDKLLAFGKKHRITGTPTIFFSDNSRVSGAMQPEAFKAKLDTLAKS